MLWVALIIMGTIAFRKQIGRIFEGVHRRIEKGSSLKAGLFELGADLEGLDHTLPYISKNHSDAGEDEWAVERTGIYQKNKGIFLAHVITPSKDHRQKYDIFIYLVRHKTKDFSDVEKAEFFFGHL